MHEYLFFFVANLRFEPSVGGLWLIMANYPVEQYQPILASCLEYVIHNYHNFNIKDELPLKIGLGLGKNN